MRPLHMRVAVPALLAATALSAQSVRVQGSLRSRVEMWDWFNAAANDTYAFSGNILRLSFGQQLKRVDWQVEFAAPFLLGLPNDAVAPAPQGQLGLGANYFVANQSSRNAGMVFAKQAFVRFKLDEGNSLRLGRFEFSDGAEVVPADAALAWVKRERISQRLIGPFGWSHAGRSFDGAHNVWNHGKNNFTAVAALPTRGAFQVDGWGNLKAGLGYAAFTRQLQSKRVNADYRIFGIYYQDWRSVLKTDNRTVAARTADRGNIRVGSIGAHAVHSVTTAGGPADVMLWGVLQTGRWGSLDHRAGAYAIEGGWQPAILPRVKPWLRAGWSHTSGDGDPADREHGTFFQILPTPRPYARFPFFNMMNNEDLFGMLMLRPHKAVSVRAEVHGLRLSERSDQWLLGGGAFQPWSFGYVGRPGNGGRGLATLYDTSVDWAATKQLSLTAYFGHARGHSVVRNVYPTGSTAMFGYLEATVRY